MTKMNKKPCPIVCGMPFMCDKILVCQADVYQYHTNKSVVV